MLTNNYPLQKIFDLSTGFELLKPNCHFSELLIQKVTISMVIELPFCIWRQNIIRYLCCLKSFILLKSVEYFKSYRYLSALC